MDNIFILNISPNIRISYDHLYGNKYHMIQQYLLAKLSSYETGNYWKKARENEREDMRDVIKHQLVEVANLSIYKEKASDFWRELFKISWYCD